MPEFDITNIVNGLDLKLINQLRTKKIYDSITRIETWKALYDCFLTAKLSVRRKLPSKEGNFEVKNLESVKNKIKLLCFQ